MDFLPYISDLVNSQGSAFIAGILAAFTPCTIAIFPIFLYRFGFWGAKKDVKKNYIGLFAAAIGFLISFAVTGIVLQQIVVSNLANVLRLLLGALLVFVGLLQLFGRLNIQSVNKFSNPLALGLSLPWILSFSPCVLVFTAGLAGSATSLTAQEQVSTAAQFMLFGAGMLVPVVLLVLGGNSVLNLVRKSTKLYDRIERISAWLVIFAGIYMSAQLINITSTQVTIAGIIILLLMFVFVYLVITKDKLNITNVAVGALVIGISIALILLSIAITQPYDDAALNAIALGKYSCGDSGHNSSQAAVPLSVIFSLIALLPALWYKYSPRLNKLRLVV